MDDASVSGGVDAGGVCRLFEQRRRHVGSKRNRDRRPGDAHRGNGQGRGGDPCGAHPVNRTVKYYKIFSSSSFRAAAYFHAAA